MLECALYSYSTSLDQLDVLKRTFNCTETEYTELVFIKEDTLIIIKTNEKITKIIKKKQVDKNKNRKHVVSVIEESEADSLDSVVELMNIWGFESINKTRIKEILFSNKDFYVSASKEFENINLKENELDSHWLIKVFSLANTLQQAEQIFNVESIRLEPILSLYKAEINYFQD